MTQQTCRTILPVTAILAVLLVVGATFALGASGDDAERVPVPTGDVEVRPTGPFDGTAADWVHAAETGEPLPILVDGVLLRLQLATNDDLVAGPDVVRDADGTPYPLDALHLLEGTVQDEPESVVRATVHGDRVEGILHTPRTGYVAIVSALDGGYGVATGAEMASLSEEAHDHMIDEEPDGPLVPVVPADGPARMGAADAAAAAAPPGGCLAAAPPYAAHPAGLVTGWPARTFDVAFAVDHEFADSFSDWQAQALGFANMLDGFYAHDIDLNIRVVDLHAHDAATLAQTSGSGALSELKGHYDDAHAGLDRENVHLFMGKDIDGPVAGQANCIGGAGYPAYAYTVGEATDMTPLNVLGLKWFPDVALKIAAHELGHILSAHHHYANCAEHAPAYDPYRTLDMCGLMFNDVGLVSLEFSQVNKLVTRGWADQVGI